jgi:hypothetical protein
MGKLIVDAEYIDYKTGKWIIFARNIKIEVIEACNTKMIQAFEEQHPRLLKRVPVVTDSRGFSYRNYFQCKPHYDSWKD